MRRIIVLSLSLMLASGIAFAADDAAKPASPGAAKPAAMSTEPVIMPKTDTGTAPAAVDNGDEPDLKVTKDSGGTPHSFLIADAPLPGDYVMGKRGAPIAVVEYASMSCPHCAHFSNTVLPVLQKKYIEAGKVAYVLRQFPLNEPALKGAMLLDCVGEQNADKYYTFAKVLFDAQSKWAFDGNYMAGLETIATVGGLTKEQFQNCTNNTDREIKVLKAKKAANDELKIPHTPYIFIDGQVYEGDRSPEGVSAFIDSRLTAHGH